MMQLYILLLRDNEYQSGPKWQKVVANKKPQVQTMTDILTIIN